MSVTGIFAGAFLNIIFGKIAERASYKFLEKPATKVFEDSSKKLKDKRMLENMKMKDFSKLCDPICYPESRRIIENVYQTLDISEPERKQLFADFSTIFSGNTEDLNLVFNEFIKIFLREVVESSRDTGWKYWVWKQMKETGRCRFLLESLEEALNFNEREEKWFRGSPFWIDFESNRIFRTAEVDKVKEKLKRENIQIVCGEAASGKSVIIKHIGYEYCREPKPVFVINLKTDSMEWYRKDVVDLLDRDALLIIDDAHLAFHDVDWVARKATNKPLKVLISTRPIKRKTIPKEHVKLEILMEREENFTEIQVSENAMRIAEFYISQKYGEEKSGVLKDVGFNLARKYYGDLWLLSFALEAFSPETGVDMTEIYANINEKYLERIAVRKDTFIFDSYKYLHPICVFYQYEIPICKDFLLRNLGLNEMYLNQLIECGEILQKGKMLSLHHSSRAEHFLKAMLFFNLCEEKEGIEFIREYVRSFHKFTCDMIDKMTRSPYERLDIVADLILDSELLTEIVKGIDEVDDLGAVSKCLSAIIKINTKVAENIVNMIDAKNLVRKINKTSNLFGIGSCLSCIALISEKKTGEIMDEIDGDWPIRKVFESDDLWEVGDYFSEIAKVDTRTVKELTKAISSEWFVRKMDESGLPAIGEFLLLLAEIDMNSATRLVEGIDKKILAARLIEGPDLVDVMWCFSGIAEANENTAKELLPVVIEYVEGCDLWSIEEFILRYGLGHAAGQLVPIGAILARKMERAFDSSLKDLGSYLASISEADEDVAKELVAPVAREIDRTHDLWDIASCLSRITLSSWSVAKELTEQIDKMRFVRKIDETRNLKDIGLCLLRATEANEFFSRDIVGRINKDNIVNKINEASDLWEIIWCLLGVAGGNKTAAGGIVEKLDLEKLAAKIDETSDLPLIFQCFSTIDRVNKSTTRKILDLLSPEKRGRIRSGRMIS
ncbi:MAG: hypothetical protein HXS44_15440 [Theionarchaea archaeon]|nr:hypothetical protein [Theionarchaea archaeon]